MKVLVSGSAGFLMSNFIRYMMYRSKDFEFVSFDSLDSPENHKLVYVNRNHKFYIGDATDKHFLDRLISIEKPDVIINGIDNVFSLDNVCKYNKAIELLSSYKIPMIQLSLPDGTKYSSFYRLNNHMVSKNGLVIELPNCFGWRQKTQYGFAKIIKNVITNNFTEVNPIQMPWVFGEDVASFIWFAIESNLKGTVKMPVLGRASIEQMKDIIIQELGIKEIIILPTFYVWDNQIVDFKGDKTKWVPDSSNLDEAFRKTIRWYIANQWMLKY